MAEAKILGVLGFPVEHSQSPQIFSQFFLKESLQNWSYKRFGFPAVNDFVATIATQPELVGFNVTIPHKMSIMPHLDWIDIHAKRIGAVNTVAIKRLGTTVQLHGYNTDYDGFLQSVHALPVLPKNAIILGTGGAAKAVAAVLQDLNIPFKRVSRKASAVNDLSYKDLPSALTVPNILLVNTTPVGMSGFPQQELDLPYSDFPNDMQVIDLIYNPIETVLLQKCREKQLTCLNGALMLQKQAEKAWQIFKTYS